MKGMLLLNNLPSYCFFNQKMRFVISIGYTTFELPLITIDMSHLIVISSRARNPYWQKKVYEICEILSLNKRVARIT